MIIIRFTKPETEVQALGYLALHFSGKTWANGETMVPEESLTHLTAEGFEFAVVSEPSYERQ